MSRPARRRALVSVFRKDGIADLCRRLAKGGFEIISTGGTARHLAQEGIPVTPVEEITGFPEMLGGRVKTLHPLVHGAILFRRDEASHREAASAHGMVPIDLVAVNLYPFADTAARPDARREEIVEMIDIGGPSMVRAAAKNHQAVTVLVDPEDYAPVLAEIEASGDTTADTRQRLAARAFAHCAAYDAQVAAFLSGTAEDGTHWPATFQPFFQRHATLRYGENPHQRAALYREPAPAPASVVAARVLQGKELSFNNYLDLDAAWLLAGEFEEPVAVVVKHNNPCGVATAPALATSYVHAREADPLSAFGGIVAVNRPVDGETAREMVSTFLEAIVAPGYTDEARTVLAAKRNLRLLDSQGAAPGDGAPTLDFRRVTGGLLLQDFDREPAGAGWKVVSRRTPTSREQAAMAFGWKVARHVRSNAIVYAAPDRTLGIGAGQMSRVDAARIGAFKARTPLQGSALASDAFFPFRDAVDAAAEVGVTAIVQPGGSIRDPEVIAAADEADMALVFTGVRHFRH